MVDGETPKNTGLLVKHPPKFVRWESASLREASIDEEGYYLKVDGVESESGKMEQIYLYLSGSDVVEIISGWAKAISEKGSGFDKFLLQDVLMELKKVKA